MPFTKLDSEFASSSIFKHGLDVVGFWAYLLSQADSDGRVTATVPDMAARCRVPESRIVEMLSLLDAPDPWSRTPENEGRRIVIERTPRWAVILLNHGSYRQRDITNAERQQRFRDRHRNVTQVTPVTPSASVLRSVSVSVEGGVGETIAPYRPHAADRAEQAVTAEIRRLQLVLGGKLAELAEHPNSRDMGVPDWTRRVTAYDRQDGSRANGVADYRTLMSIPRLEKSIEDAEYWLKKLAKGPLEAKRGA